MKKNYLDYFEEYFCMAMLAFMTVLIFVQVIMRYVFSNSLSWSEEVARFCFIWLSWIGASYCVKIDAHLRVTALLSVLPKKLLPYINLLMYICWGLFSLDLAYEGFKLIQMIYERGQASPALLIPMWIPVACVPVGSALMTFRLLGKVYDTVKEIMSHHEVATND